MNAKLTEGRAMLFLTERKSKSPSVVWGLGILVVDDNRACADTMSALFRSLGAVTTVAYDGISAIERFDGGRHQVVILDLAMPVLTGFDVARYIRSVQSLNSVVLIALSGADQDEPKAKCVEAGINHYVRKPAEINALLGVIAQSVPPRDEMRLA